MAMTLNGNPTLRRVVRGSEEGKYLSEDNRVVSMKGMAWKSVLFCLVTIISAVVSAYLLLHFIDTGNANAITTLVIILGISVIPLIIISFVIMFFPKTASFLGIIYCILEGLAMGVTSAIFDMFIFPGIALMAFLGTCVVFIVSLLVFNLLGRHISGKFVKFVLTAFISMVLLQGIGFLLSWAIPAFAAIMNNIWVQLAVSGIMVLWASFMLLIDLNNMQQLADNQADKQYEWLAAFSLVTTLMWLYVEILELLARLALIFRRE